LSAGLCGDRRHAAPTPELSTFAMLTAGFAGLGFLGFQRRATAAA
jgi:hypothetical protein